MPSWAPDRLDGAFPILTATTALIVDSLKGAGINYPKWSVARDLFLPVDRKKIRIMRGREFDWFEGSSTDDFLSQDYILGHNSNRMGYQLKGKELKREVGGELLSSAVTPGTWHRSRSFFQST